MTEDIPYPFHQNNNFLYLTGFMVSNLVSHTWAQAQGRYSSHQNVFFEKFPVILKEFEKFPVKLGVKAIGGGPDPF